MARKTVTKPSGEPQREAHVPPGRLSAANGSISKVRLPKAGELVARNLRNRIIRGEIPEGAMLPPEQEMVHQFGVSRPTLREAIRILESEQLLEITRGLKGGARVLRPNVDVAARYFGFLLQSNGVKLSDVFRTQVMIEPAAVRYLARERRPETVAKLRACLQEEADAQNATERALAIAQFHRLVVEETGNTTLILLMSMLSSILDRYFVAVAAVYGQYVDAAADTAKATNSRKRLVDLIEKGDEDKAAYLWRNFLQEAEVKFGAWQPSELVVDLLQGD